MDLRDDATYKSWLAAATDRFAEAIARADLDAPVPTCPEWDIADLVGHVVAIHAWVERILATAEAQSAGAPQTAPEREPGRYADWYRQRAAAMRAAMEATDPDAPCWNFSGVNTTFGFWPRRQTHEVGVHTVDVALASGAAASIEPEIAADGIDEVLRVFGVRMAARGFPASGAAPIAIEPIDVDRAWTIAPPPADGSAPVVHDGAGADAAASLRGTAADVLLALWKRIPADRLDVAGDAAVANGYLGSRLVP